MMRVAAIWSVLLLVAILGLTQATGSGRNYKHIKPAELSDEELWRNGWEEAWHNVYNNPKALEQLKKWQKAYDETLDTIEIPEFTCDWDVAPGKRKAESVNELRPNDIQVIGALGDSITAAFGLGADSPVTVVQENRGESWTIGRNDDIETVVTIPNLIRKFNPNVFGGSWAKPPVSCTGGLNCSQLNVAVSGATNRGIPGQMENLIEKMQDYESQGLMSIADDWKVVSLFIGGNDLCRVCVNPEANNPEVYVSSIKEAVNNLRAQVPRVLVNLIIMFDITPIADMEDDAEEYPDFCRNMHETGCPCVLDPENDLRAVQMDYYNLLNQWINVNGTYDEENEFTVVLQTQMRDQKPAYDDDGFFDMTYFAPDCFHPSRKGHQALALALWNTMLTPVQDKGFEITPSDPLEFKCPTEENPFIFTRENSGVVKSKPKMKHHNKIVSHKETGTEEWMERWGKTWQKVLSDKEHRKVFLEWEMHNQQMEELAQNDLPTFDCDVTISKNRKAENVNVLTPGDIGVVAALGDSITAGTGVDPDNAGAGHRGEVWSIGGNHNINEAVTLPNFIKEYNPGLFGWSWSKPPASCGRLANCSQLNVAQGGATNRNFPSQADDLIAKFEQYSDEGLMDYDNDWKLVTMFIGGNDLCAVCNNDLYLPGPYVDNIKIAVEKLRESVPRVLVQVVTMFDISPIRNMTDFGYNNTAFCRAIHLGVCSCAINDDDGSSRRIQMGYWDLLEEWINTNGTYDGIDDFSVVLQPQLRDMPAPYTDDGYFDMSYFSSDCFHPSRKLHRDMAYTLWDTMLTPVGEKVFSYPYIDIADAVYKCPTEENPYIFTRGNSGVEKKKPSIFDEEQDGPEQDLIDYQEKQRKAIEWFQSQPQEVQDAHHKWSLENNDFDFVIPDWTCDPPVAGSYKKAETAHELRPSDIQVIGAFGDSVSAGNGVGANTLPGVAIENRGEVWSIGGNGTVADTPTMTNILRQFNPDIHGWSWSRSSSIGERNDTHCAQGWNCAQLNVAEPGGTCRNMLPQAIEITARMQSDPAIDFENDWKMVTLFIGGNDLCAVCRRWDDYNPEKHVADIAAAIDYLHANVPRMLVNIATMFDITPLIDMDSGDAGRNIICNTMHSQFCDCVKNPDYNPQMRDIQFEYWERLDDLINTQGAYDQPGREDFTVVLQPMMRDMEPAIYDDGIWDMSWFAPDCFHPSRKFHMVMSYIMWNTMLTPVGEKTYDYDLEEELAFACPSEERPYIFTNLNSGATKNAVPELMAAQKNSQNNDQKKGDHSNNQKKGDHSNDQKKGDHSNDQKKGEHNSATYKHTTPKHNASSKKQHTRSSPSLSSSSSSNQQHKQIAVIAVMGTMLASVLVGALLVGVVLPKWKKYRATKASTAPQHFDNPAYLSQHLN